MSHDQFASDKINSHGLVPYKNKIKFTSKRHNITVIYWRNTCYFLYSERGIKKITNLKHSFTVNNF